MLSLNAIFSLFLCIWRSSRSSRLCVPFCFNQLLFAYRNVWLQKRSHVGNCQGEWGDDLGYKFVVVDDTYLFDVTLPLIPVKYTSLPVECHRLLQFFAVDNFYLRVITNIWLKLPLPSSPLLCSSLCDCFACYCTTMLTRLWYCWLPSANSETDNYTRATDTIHTNASYVWHMHSTLFTSRLYTACTIGIRWRCL